jgi:DNA repair protein RadD
MTTLRPYQDEAIAAVFDYWSRGGGNPLIDLATGTGKSVVLAKIVRDVVEGYDASVIVLTHVKELVEQDLKATLRLWPGCPAGINSAGLGRRDKRSKVLFASIQSIYNDDALSLGKRQLIIVDEAHLVPRDGDGMYLKFIAKMREAEPDLRVLGLTATPYRLDSGRLDKGNGRIFDEIVYSYGIGEGVRDGYLSPLTARNGDHGQIDARGVAKRGGDFADGAIQAASIKDGLVEAACAEIVRHGADRRGWIAFGTGVEHANKIADCLRSMGVATACVTGKTERGERDRAIRAFKAGELRCLTSVGVLTTGFDAPHVDLIAMLRPTLSTGLYVQMLGRGTRLAPGKSNCLVLDFSGNVRRHGPVDAIDVKGGGKLADDGEKPAVKEETVRAKACPHCGSLHALHAPECLDCGFVWPVAAKHVERPDLKAAVMARDVEAEWQKVDHIALRSHTSAASGNRSLRVDYACGIATYSEWVTIEAAGYAREKAALWWRALVGPNVPAAVNEALGVTVNVTHVRVSRDGKYWRVNQRMRADGAVLNDKMKLTRPQMETA